MKEWFLDIVDRDAGSGRNRGGSADSRPAPSASHAVMNEEPACRGVPAWAPTGKRDKPRRPS